jgi:hypothetical protein
LIQSIMPRDPHQQVIAMMIEPLPLSPAGGGSEPWAARAVASGRRMAR